MSFANMACTRSINVYDSPLARPMKGCAFPAFYSVLPMIDGRLNVGKMVISRGSVACSAAPESSTVTVPESKEETVSENAAPAKPKRTPPAKALAKALPQLMEEEVIPSLRSTLEAQEDLLQIELSFQDNRLEGSFIKNGIPYYFWAFFPDGLLTGPKGFALSSHGSEASTVEPFLIDEKKITAKHVVFWVEKRLAAQGIIPVWIE
ncbi:uncharacterized protein LOC131257834 [Magnolia sinica]|uniref:uncharacterized protein LOC131257834 n=1 Tax=Magnolia sinica TaxID=86752 RepID=UPI0026588E7B|nr:uncharacterized protein LOC131257834 [Magnolia sinica]